MASPFEIAAGSIPGRAHVETGRNNQDAHDFVVDDDAVAAVVCDGCSAGEHSEIGARLAARLLVRALHRGLRSGGDEEAAVRQAFADVGAQMAQTARTLGDALPETVRGFFLFTVVGVAATRAMTVTFSVGDGALAVNGQRTTLGPFPGNAPPYWAYSWIDGAPLDLKIHHAQPTAEVREVVLATDGALDLDGAQPIEEFARDALAFRNPDRIRRRLVVLARKHALRDDTTVLALRQGEAT